MIACYFFSIFIVLVCYNSNLIRVVVGKGCTLLPRYNRYTLYFQLFLFVVLCKLYNGWFMTPDLTSRNEVEWGYSGSWFPNHGILNTTSYNKRSWNVWYIYYTLYFTQHHTTVKLCMKYLFQPVLYLLNGSFDAFVF